MVGYFARQLGAIPVQRAQDNAIPGPGTVMIRGTKVVGTGTAFMKDFGTGASFAIPGESEGMRVAKLVSDTELELAAVPSRGDVDSIKYKIVPKLDQAKVYEAVWERLGTGGAIGIFPEGGSHDRADLLPLKAGVSIMALGAMAKYKGTQVSIIPCGLNYWSGHRFRSTVVVEFGQPFKIPFDLVEQYQEGAKREACGALLEITENLLRGVTFNACDFPTRRVIQTIRHLYVPSSTLMPVDKYMEFTRKLAKGYDEHKDEEDVNTLKQQVMNYNEQLDLLGVTDDHVASDDTLGSTFKFVWMAFLRLIAMCAVIIFAGPGFLLNLPIAIVARVVAAQQAKKAKAGSQVKIAGTDVMASYKVIIGLVVTPILYSIYAVLVFVYFGFLWLLAFMVLWPLFSWASVRATEGGVKVLKSFLTLLKLQLWASELKSLRQWRKQLQVQAHRFGLRVAPEFAPENFAHLSNEPSTFNSIIGRFSKQKGYISKHEEFRRVGIPINESIENLEALLMDSDGHY